MIKILIADDHAIVRHGIKEIVNSDSQMTIIGEASNGMELLSLAREMKADVVILDISMPGRNGLETLKELKQNYPSLPVIVLSMHPEDQYAVRVIKAGAAGYMNKESAPEELIEAIKKVFRGGKYISPKLAEILAFHIEGNFPDQPHKSLSDREFQVFQSIATGRSVGQISEDLNLSVKTISTYRTRIMEKMNMKTNAEIIRYAVDQNLV